MTPIWGKSHEPDERPSTGEVVGAILLAIVVAFLYWIATILFSPIPKVTP